MEKVIKRTKEMEKRGKACTAHAEGLKIRQ